MRFEICETVETPDQEKVLRALETCSWEVSSHVVRYGDRITLQGLGPSPRAKNVRDTTVFCVNAEDDKTIINGEVNFQASALLGDQSQGDVVRSKLEELFNQMKAQIDLDANRAMRAGATSPNTTVAADSVVGIAPSEDGSVLTLTPEGQPETMTSSPERGLVDTAPVDQPESATGSEQTAELERNESPDPNSGEEPGAKLDRSVWLDDLFHQMKAQFELDEKLATHADAAASLAAPLPETTVVADSVVTADISERADDETVVLDGDPKVMNASSEPGSDSGLANAAVVPESVWAVGSEKSAEPEQTDTLEQHAKAGHADKHERSVLPEQDFDLKENAWLHDLFQQMNARIELDGRLEARDPVATGSIHTALLPTADAVAPIGTEGIPLEERVGTDAPSTMPKVTSVVESELAAGSQGDAESEHAELDQNPVMEPNAELERNPELGLTPGMEKSTESQQTAPLPNSVDAVQAPTTKPSVDPGKDVWLEELKEVIESDLHIRRRIEEGVVTGEDEEATPRKRLAVWVTGLAVLLLAAAGTYSLYRPRFDPAVPSVQAIEEPTAITTNPVPAAEPSHPADVKPSEPATPTEIVNPVLQVADVRVWLENWAAAMRTRDASAQAAFYADTVNEYVGKYDVSKDAVLKDREATIHMRKGLWTVKMEKVVIERQTKSEAEVQLVKHFIDEPVPSEIVESFVPTRLTLKRLNGMWKITSEQDLPTSSAASVTR